MPSRRRIAENAGAVAVMALERVPADIRRDGGVARMADPTKIKEIQEAGLDPGHGQVPHRPLRRGADPRGARGRLHRRVRGADARRLEQPRRQVEVHGAVRLRLHESRRGAAAHRRGRGDDPHEGRSRHRRHRRTRSRTCARCFGTIRRLGAMRDEELFSEAKEAARAVRARPVGGRERAPAGRDVHRRRHRDAGRRGALHAARRGRRLRRLRDLQVRRPGSRAKAIVEATTHFEDPRSASRACRRASASRWSASRPRQLDPAQLLETRGW